MARHIKVTMQMTFTKSGPPTGFSESWCRSLPGSPSDQTVRDTAQAWSQVLAARRLTCLSEDWKITGIRTAELVVATNGAGKCYWKATEIGIIACPNTLTGKEGPADTPWTSVYAVLGAGSHPRRQQMRGVPDIIWASGAFNAPLATQKFNSFLNLVAPATPNEFGAWKLSFATGSGDCASKARVERYQSWCIKRASSRRIGRPFDLLRGRRSNRPVEPTPTP